MFKYLLLCVLGAFIVCMSPIIYWVLYNFVFAFTIDHDAIYFADRVASLTSHLFSCFSVIGGVAIISYGAVKLWENL